MKDNNTKEIMKQLKLDVKALIGFVNILGNNRELLKKTGFSITYKGKVII